MDIPFVPSTQNIFMLGKIALRAVWFNTHTRSPKLEQKTTPRICQLGVSPAGLTGTSKISSYSFMA